MNNISPFLRGVNQASDAMTKKVMNAFARNYETSLNKMFEQLHKNMYEQQCKAETYKSAETSNLEAIAKCSPSQIFFDMTTAQLPYDADAIIMHSMLSRNTSNNADEAAKTDGNKTENSVNTDNGVFPKTVEDKNETPVLDDTNIASVNVNAEVNTDNTAYTVNTESEYSVDIDNIFSPATSENETDAFTPEYTVTDDVYNYGMNFETAESNINTINEFSYNADEYHRLAFNDRASAVMFLKEMQEQQIDVVSTANSINGQYLVEVPLYTKSGKDVRDVIDNFVSETYLTISQPKQAVIEENMPSNGFKMLGSDALNTILFRNMEGIGSGYQKFIQVGTNALQWGGETNQKEYFNTALNARHEATPKIFTGFANRATVLYGDTVIINGQLVTDESVKNDILEQHKKREELADKILAKRDESERSKICAEITQELNGRAVEYDVLLKNELKEGDIGFENRRDSLIKSDEFFADIKNSLGIVPLNGKYKKEDVKEAVEAAINRIKDSGINLYDEFGRFSAKALKDISSSQLAALGISENAMQLITRVYAPEKSARLNLKQLNAEAFKEAIYRQEYTQRPSKERKKNRSKSTDLYNTVGVFCHWTFGALDDITNAVNQEMLVRKTIIEHKLSAFSDADSKLIKEALEKLGLDIGSLATNRGFKNTVNKIKVSEKLSESERTKLLELLDKEKFLLSGAEKNMISAYSPFIDDIATSSMFKGLKLGNKPLTREDLLKINEAFINGAAEKGFLFVKGGISPSFNIKKLENLTSAELARLGITARTRDRLVALNKKGAFGNSYNLTTSLKNAGSKLGFLITKLDDDGNWQDVLSAKNNLMMFKKYSQKAVTSVRRLGNIRVKDLANIKKLGKKGLKELYDKPLKPLINKKPKTSKLTEKQKSRISKYLTKQQKVLSKTTKIKTKRLGSKLQSKINAVKNKLANKALGKAVQSASKALTKLLTMLIVCAVIAALIIGFILVIIMIVATLIQCLLEFSPVGFINDLLAPQTYEDTVAYSLYEYLDDFEEDWVNSIQAYDDIYANMSEVKYGVSYQSFDDYISSINNLVTDDSGALYINPFSYKNAVTFDKNEEMLTKLSSFTGFNTTSILTNASIYNTKTTLGDSTAYDNGHTSNIKDIISMTDILFQYELNSQSDDRLESIMGCSPAQLQWNEFCTNVGNIFRCIGNFFAGLFGSTEPPFPIEKAVTYGTIKNYAATLYQCSHQQTVSYGVNFYDINKELKTLDGTTLSGDVLYQYGICNEPVTGKFYVGYDSTTKKTSPYFTADGSKYWLDRDIFETNVYLKNAVDISGLCLKTTYGDNLETYNSIKGNACWKETTNTTDKVRLKDSTTGENKKWRIYFENEEDLNYVKQCLSLYSYKYAESSGQTTVPTDVYKFSSSSRSRFRAITYKSLEEYVSSNDKKDVSNLFENGTDIKQDSDKHDGKEYIKVFDVEESKKTGEYSIKYKEMTLDEFDEDAQLNRLEMIMYVAEENTIELTRECQKHDFKYCGGHLSCHSNGIVYSATNEQLDSTGVYSDDMKCVTNHFANSREMYGWKYLKGKYIGSEVDTTSALTMSMTGQCAKPESGLQGSAISGTNGMNLWVEGEEWVEGGINADYIKDNAFKFQDIFDVDCCLLYGRNVFPYDKPQSYQGWTEDNMAQALNRIAMDWYEPYGFDIPLEIGSSKLGEADKEKIINALKSKYGGTLTPKREEAIRTALSYVGRGHSNENHDEHAYLTNMCSAHGYFTASTPNGITIRVSRAGNCTATSDKGFAMFYLKRAGLDASLSTLGYMSGVVASGFTNCKPADLIMHSKYINEQDNVSYIPFYSSEEGVDYKNGYNNYVDTQYAIYIGTLSQDLQLQTGQTLKAGVPLLIDVTNTSYGGAIQLHGESSTSVYSSNTQEVYWWVQNLDGRVRYKSIE